MLTSFSFLPVSLPAARRFFPLALGVQPQALYVGDAPPLSPIVVLDESESSTANVVDT